MKRFLSLALITAATFLLMASSAFAVAPTGVKANNVTATTVDVSWTTAGAGEAVWVSLDGTTWQQANGVAGPAGTITWTQNAGKSVGGVLYGTVSGLTQWTNYYFLVKDSLGNPSTIVDAFPPDEHAHKYFAADTKQCANCHSTHTAVGTKLTNQATINDVCFSCHTGGSPKSKYMVDEGKFNTGAATDAVNLGGGFGKTINAAASFTPTSAHDMGALLKTAYGGDTTSAAADWNAPLGCAGCHSAHVPPDGTYQYRLLRSSLPNMTPSGGVALSAITVNAFAKSDLAGKREVGYYVSGMNNFCGGCHADYNTSQINKPGSLTKSGVFNTSYYRHAVDKNVNAYGAGLTTKLPLESAGLASDGTPHTNGLVNCITCHIPHASTVTNGIDKDANNANAATSKLLRQDQRGVCEECHAK